MKRKLYNYFKTSLFLIFIFIGTSAKAQVPVADFIVCKKTIEIYEVIQLIDLSTNSPNAWFWDINYCNYDSTGPRLDDGSVEADPNGLGRDQFSHNPELQFFDSGCYTITLKVSNQNGSSTVVKKGIINVLNTRSTFLGYGYTYTDFNYGKIYDNGGGIGEKDMDYLNNQGSGTRTNLKILPSNNKKITINFKQIKLADAGDFITIYDSDTVSSNILAVITNANNGQNLTFKSTQSKMYITFETNSIGTDSGFYAEYYTDYNPYVVNKEINVVRNLVNVQSVFTNKNQEDYIKNYTRKWYVNNNLQSSFTNMDTLKYTFTNTSAYQVCLKISDCDTSFQYCVIDSNKTCEAYFEVYPDTTLNYSGIIQDFSTASTSSTYLWDFGDGDTTTTKTPTHTYTGQGVYNLCLTINDSSCVSQYCKYVGFDSSGNLLAALKPFSIKIVDKNGNSLALSKITFENFDFYPNPVQTYLTIKDFDFVNYKMELYNSSGQIINKNISNEIIDFSNFSNGLYFLKITNMLGEYKTYKVLKY